MISQVDRSIPPKQEHKQEERRRLRRIDAIFSWRYFPGAGG
jgi:hypothetical protein